MSDLNTFNKPIQKNNKNIQPPIRVNKYKEETKTESQPVQRPRPKLETEKNFEGLNPNLIVSNIEKKLENVKPKLESLIAQNQFNYRNILTNIFDQLNCSDKELEYIFELANYKNEYDFKTNEEPVTITSIIEISESDDLTENKFNESKLSEMLVNKNITTNYEYLHGQSLIVFESITSRTKELGIKVNLAEINEYLSEYKSIKKESESLQSNISNLPESQNEYCKGFNELVFNPVKYIQDNFRVNTHYSIGDIVQGELENQKSKEIGQRAEEEVNLEISTIMGVLAVVSGPGYSVLDTNKKVDSLVFTSEDEIDSEIKNKLSELLNTLANYTYQESLLNDYNSTKVNKIRTEEVQSKDYLYELEKEKLIKKEIYIINGQLIQILSESVNLSNELNNATDESTKQTLINKQNQIDVRSENLHLKLIEKKQDLQFQKANTESIYKQYNPDGLSTPIALGPFDQIGVYFQGNKENNANFIDLKGVNINEVSNQINQILLSKNIKVNSVQIKNNVNSKNVTDALTSGKITGAIGFQTQNPQKLSRKESLEISLNIGFGIEQYI
jgi:hypothetical protein